jgi:hypothetical protein
MKHNNQTNGAEIPRSRVTYGQIDNVLRSYGFSACTTDNARIYDHESTGARISFPLLPLTDLAYPHHVGMVLSAFKVYGLADQLDLAARLQPTS